ncbi:MAG TPA: tetraacyldisaccharide 4'-kinase [Methylophilaceae bacterium]|nr:tetraacyldisaccharide 4'-kinase [Methylophilaceae bacterium]
MNDLILRAWKNKNLFFYIVLIPLSWLFTGLTALRRLLYRVGLLRSYLLPVPVIVVGNINMGGSGKTPAVIWLVNQLKEHGYRPGVISRGYGAKVTQPMSVKADSLPEEVGDEPVLIAQKTGCPLYVSADRVSAGNSLLKMHPECNVIISDDGLQHYRLQRQIEIAVVDQQSQPNQHLLPAGQLREPYTRLESVDAVILNGNEHLLAGYLMQLQTSDLYNLLNPDLKKSVGYFQGKHVAAMAGIGKPERFFKQLQTLGLQFTQWPFNDHHAFTSQELSNIKCDALIMTEKDAVKCQAFAEAHHWVLPVAAKIDGGLMPMLLSKLKQKTK